MNPAGNRIADVNQNIGEMIEKWSKKKFIEDLEYVNDGENLFVDGRGKISNHELTEPINLIGLINSKKGTIRANHYHPQQEQKCLFTKGQIIEVYKDNLLDLLDLLNRFPGAQIISKIIALLDCPIPPIFDPSLADFLKDIDLPFCRNTYHIGLPRLENPFIVSKT